MIHRMISSLRDIFSKRDFLLWCSSAGLILISFLRFDRQEYLTLLASLIGVTSLIFAAKGHPVGQALMVLFSILYGVISWNASYYGEMITYLGMTGPMSAFSLISWLRHPYKGKRSEVEVNQIRPAEWVGMMFLTALVTAVFYFILKYFHTAQLPLSTLSVTTSFLAVYLTFRRSSWYAAAYAANDVVLVCLWLLAARKDPGALSVAACFMVFFANDLYGFLSWKAMALRQQVEQ